MAPLYHENPTKKISQIRKIWLRYSMKVNTKKLSNQKKLAPLSYHETENKKRNVFLEGREGSAQKASRRSILLRDPHNPQGLPRPWVVVPESGPPFGPGGERPEPLPLPGGRWTFLGLGGRAAAPGLPAPPSDQGQVGAESGSRGPAESASKG